MVQINFARKEINCKIVYYGPGLSGKTTNLEMVHLRTPENHKGDLTSISTDGDRTLFFDFMPLDLGEVAGMKTKFHLYTVPGQVYYNSTRKLVLLGVDGVIFVADSDPARMNDNIQSLENLRENLVEMGRELTKIPWVIQYNKRDLKNAMTVDELEKALNKMGVPSFEASAKTGEGVFQTLKAISGLVLENINSTERKRSSAEQQDRESRHQASKSRASEPAKASAPAPAASASRRESEDYEDIPLPEPEPEARAITKAPAAKPLVKKEPPRRAPEPQRAQRPAAAAPPRVEVEDQEELDEAEEPVAAPRAVAAPPKRKVGAAPETKRVPPRAKTGPAAAAKPARAAPAAAAARESKGSPKWLMFGIALLGAGGAAAAFAVYKFVLH